ncbi:MAG: hypothetical protein HQ583_11205 [Candidatus Abyssubacteria bacterium]|nr:hypothetical protein [Candidatus Abyssubacteria bacterium]
MKLQYLGDSKDSFKWHYHDYLAQELGFPLLNIAFMMTPDDGSNDGKSDPSLFPAGREIIKFCKILRKKRSIDEIRRLPKVTGAKYEIKFHNNEDEFKNQNREHYFSGFSAEKDHQLVFLDPDTGFEPKEPNETHVLYSDIKSILGQISYGSVISVFQHFRRKKFEEDFAEIKKGLPSEHATAIWWRSAQHSVMFVAVGKSQKDIAKVREANENYLGTIQPKLAPKSRISTIP